MGNKKTAVYEEIKKRIIDGTLTPGLPINETEFAQDFNVSKTPVREALRQPQHEPLSVSRQIVIIYAAGQGYLDDLPIDQVRDFEQYLFEYIESHHKLLMEQLERGNWPRQVRTELPQAIENCVKAFASRRAEE